LEGGGELTGTVADCDYMAWQHGAQNASMNVEEGSGLVPCRCGYERSAQGLDLNDSGVGVGGHLVKHAESVLVLRVDDLETLLE